MKFTSSDVPQANNVEMLFEAAKAVAWGPASHTKIAESMLKAGASTYVSRQGAYYADACVILGLMTKGDGEYSLTRRGHQLVQTAEIKSRERLMSDAILGSDLVAALISDVGDVAEILADRTAVAHWVSSHTGLSISTATRRASTIRKYVRYALEHQ